MKSTTFLVSFAVLLVVLTPLGISDSDATGGDEEYYCYTYDLAFIYTGGTVGDINVSWSATGTDHEGNTIEIHQIPPYPSSDNGWRVKFDPNDVKKCSEVLITQIVQKDKETAVQTFKVIIVQPPLEGKYYVTFFDGYSGTAVGLYEITLTSYVPVGGSHVVLPETPVREGYSFAGWFVGPNLDQRFDPTAPVTSDIDVYAKWTETPKIPVDTTVYILLGIVVLLAAILVVVLVRMRKQRT